MAKKKRPASAARAPRRGANLFIWAGAVALIAIVAAAAYIALTGDDSGSGVVRRGSVRQPTPVVITDMQTTVQVVDTSFAPAAIQIPVGATVTWEFIDRMPHNVTEDRLVFQSKNLRSGERYSHKLDDPGTYYYYCTLHHKMLGTIIVGDGAPTPAAAATPAATP